MSRGSPVFNPRNLDNGLDGSAVLLDRRPAVRTLIATRQDAEKGIPCASAQERVEFLFAPDRGRRAVAGKDLDPLVECEQPCVDRAQQLPRIAARQVRAPDGVAEQRVAGDQLVFGPHEHAHAALRVAGRVQDLQLGRAAQQRVAVARRAVDGRRFWRGQTDPGRPACPDGRTTPGRRRSCKPARPWRPSASPRRQYGQYARA